MKFDVPGGIGERPNKPSVATQTLLAQILATVVIFHSHLH